MRSLSKILRTARELIADEARFTPYGLACDRQGVLVAWNSPKAVRWSALGALAVAAGRWPLRGEDDVLREVALEMGLVPIPGFPQDFQVLHPTAMAAFREAIARVERRSVAGRSPLSRAEGLISPPRFHGASVWAQLTSEQQAAIGAAALEYAAGFNAADAFAPFAQACLAENAWDQATERLIQEIADAVPAPAWRAQDGQVLLPSCAGAL